jgi:hypothetical protein
MRERERGRGSISSVVFGIKLSPTNEKKVYIDLGGSKDF